MTLAHALLFLLLTVTVGVGVFYLISLAERESTVEKRETALDDFNRRQNR